MDKKRSVIVLTLLLLSGGAFAGDFVFLNSAYLRQTHDVISEAKQQAAIVFKDSSSVEKLDVFANALEEKVSDVEREQKLKKVDVNSVQQAKDQAFAQALNNFNDALGAMADQAGKPIEKILPSYAEWNALETAVVKQGLTQRLADYQTRFGSDSEPINILEYVMSEKFLPGDEGGPSPWEPIFRVSAVQATTRGSGLTSTMEVGVNHYFLGGKPPKIFRAVGLSNHVGAALVVQYLDHPGLLSVRGRPSFGVMLHLDRKEVGVSWDNAEDRLNFTVGYAFQFVPLLM